MVENYPEISYYILKASFLISEYMLKIYVAEIAMKKMHRALPFCQKSQALLMLHLLVRTLLD